MGKEKEREDAEHQRNQHEQRERDDSSCGTSCVAMAAMTSPSRVGRTLLPSISRVFKIPLNPA